MHDFDDFLAGLMPQEREPDRLFVTRVQALVRLDSRLAAERRALTSRLAREAVAIAAVAAGILVLAESPVVRDFASRSPEFMLGGLLAAFGLVVAAFSNPASMPKFRRS